LNLQVLVVVEAVPKAPKELQEPKVHEVPKAFKALLVLVLKEFKVH
jgi:hypothetical protein